MFKPDLSLRSGTKIYDINGSYDLFNTAEFADTVLGIIQNYNLMKDIQMMALYGTWGAGKTTLAHYIKDNIKKADAQVIIFEAWKYEFGDDLAASLLYTLINHKKHSDTIMKRLLDSSTIITKTLATFGKNLAFNTKVKAPGDIAEIDIGNAGTKTVEKIRDATYENSTYKSIENMAKAFKKIVSQLTRGKKVFYVIIDDLDRCEPENVIRLLSIIKHFFTLSNKLKFICTIDKIAVTKAVQIKYGDIVKSNEYLEKLFDLSFKIPEKLEFDVLEYLKKYLNDEEFDSKNLHAFTKTIQAIGLLNPRQIIKCINRMYTLTKFLLITHKQHGKIFNIVEDNNYPDVNTPLHLDTYLSNPLFFDLLLYFVMLQEFHQEEFDMMMDFDKKSSIVQSNSPLLEQSRGQKNVVYRHDTRVPFKIHLSELLTAKPKGDSFNARFDDGADGIDIVRRAIQNLYLMLLDPYFILSDDGHVWNNKGQITASSKHNKAMERSLGFINHIFTTSNGTNDAFLKDRFWSSYQDGQYSDFDIVALYNFVKQH